MAREGSFSHEGGALVNEISALVRHKELILPLWSPPCRDVTASGSHQTLNLPGPLNWASVGVRHVCSLSQPVDDILLDIKVTKITSKEGEIEDKLLGDRITASATQTEG